MMNETLQKELTIHFQKINKRKKELEEIKESLNLKDSSLQDFEKEIEQEITIKVKDCLDKKKFDYEKGRNRSGDRITFKDGYLKIREFKTHGFSNLNVLGSDKLNEFLPNGLIEARQIITKKLREIEGVILEFKEKVKLRKSITIQSVGNEEIKTYKVKEIEISFNCEEEHSSFNRGRYSYSYGNTGSYKSRNQNFEIKINEHTYDVDVSLYSDEVFNAIISLIEKFKERIKKVEHIREKKRTELREFVFNQVSKMMILGELE